ncbi:hypothetical protein RsoM2USA_313 [Ralstonia phage RsoM2USA]|nr:hypothetical protein RsoM2USA_313 [Ralstonia phage RsoM2USA]
MKLNEIKKDIIRECYDWFESYVILGGLSRVYENFKEDFYDNFFMAPDGVPVLRFDTKQINIEYSGKEWTQPPFRIRAASIRIANLDCRNMDLSFIDPIIDDMQFRMHNCVVGNCQKFIDAEASVEQFDISTSDISNVVEMLRVCENVRIYLNLGKSKVLVIESVERSKFSLVDSIDKKQYDFTDIFDVQTWLIENGYEDIV